MCLYSYVIKRDYGFAPNPFWNICSLATCKPQIRERASVGDWVAGFGGAGTAISQKMVFLMRIDEICSFDEYWDDSRFGVKKPHFDGNYQQCYGDNIYHHINNEWTQENSHHSYADGINQNNLSHDTRIDRVLLSFYYWYFGENAIELPEEFAEAIAKGRAYKKLQDNICIDLVGWVENHYEIGQQGLPYKWKESEDFVRFKGESAR